MFAECLSAGVTCPPKRRVGGNEGGPVCRSLAKADVLAAEEVGVCPTRQSRVEISSRRRRDGPTCTRSRLQILEPMRSTTRLVEWRSCSGKQRLLT